MKSGARCPWPMEYCAELLKMNVDNVSYDLTAIALKISPYGTRLHERLPTMSNTVYFTQSPAIPQAISLAVLIVSPERIVSMIVCDRSALRNFYWGGGNWRGNIFISV